MDTRFQFIFLTRSLSAIFAAFLIVSSSAFADSAEDNDILDINNEVFELGLFGGIINIENFTSEFAPGISATFRASEDYFIQYNYLRTNVSQSSAEKRLSGNESYVSGDDRTFTHYDLLVGYNFFQGEFFPSPAKASLSSLYVVAGVGDTEFGGESSMSYTVGVGYQVALNRRFGLHFDFRDYIYRSSLITEVGKSVSTTQISTGLKFSF